MKGYGWFIILFATIFIVACVGLIFSPVANETASQANTEMFPDSQSAAPVSSEPMELPAMTPETWKAIGWISVAVFVFLVLLAIVKSGGAALLAFFAIAIVFFGAMFWVIVYRAGDVSTPEARDENIQIVEVIQPVGDPESDSTNADTNRTNAGANVVNAGAFSIYAAAGWVTIVLIVFSGMLLLFAIKARTG